MRTKKTRVLLHQLLAGTMLAALAAGSSFTVANAAADLIAVNGDVRTVDPNTPRAEAFAVEGGKFVAVGTSAEIRSLADGKTTVLDLGGKTVTPGFIDGHTHLTSGTDYVTGVDLSYIPDKETWLKKIKEADERLPPGVWITGGGWDYTLGEGKLPTKEDIDAVVKDRPVVLRDIDFHSIWVNSKALEIGGVTAKSEVPAGGEIVVDAKTGEPTGILLEGAGDLVTNKKPAYSDKERAEALLQTVKFANSVGLTGVHDMSSIAAAYDYLKLVEDKTLSLRVWYGFFEDKAANIPAAAKDREAVFGLGDGPWHPEQAVTFDEALFAYTQAGANMTPWADEIGSISTGKWADFVVLDAKLPDPVDRTIRERHVEATYVAGTEVYRAK